MCQLQAPSREMQVFRRRCHICMFGEVSYTYFSISLLDLALNEVTMYQRQS